jgi:CRISPR-associated protein Csb2
VIGLELSFLAGHFHGNGWHHAHNEGIPEWPPSPWRLLRALVNAAYAEELSVADVEPVLERLRGLPRYRLPLAVDAHTRHYMPDTDDANHKKSKVFDAFVAVEGGARDPRPVTMVWPGNLATNERELLIRLCRRVTYLGRAESWADVKVVEVDGERWDCWPDERAETAGATVLLTLSSAQEFAEWVRNHPAGGTGRDIPRSLWDVLTFEGERYRREGWSSIPGTRLVRYVFAEPPFRRAVVPSSRRKPSVRPTVARFAIRSAVLPRLHEALALGERLRMSAMSQSRKVSGQARPVLSGHGELANHQHAMYLSTADDPTNAERGSIDHVLITARAGFDEEEIIALQRLRWVWGRGGHDIELVLTELGQAADIGGTKPPCSAVLAESRIWESVTPFVPTRHPKTVRGVAVETVRDQLCRGCEQLLGVRPVDVQPVGDRAMWSRFRRRRISGGGSRGPDMACGARLVFEQPVRGPIALGYGAHFGLGTFVGVRDDGRGNALEAAGR